MSKLRNLGGNNDTAAAAPPEPPKTEPALDVSWSHDVDAAVKIERIEVDAVIGGALMRVTFSAGADPAGILPFLKSLDPHAKVRDDFPMKGGGFGKRDTKRARLLVVTLKASDNGLFIDLVAKGETDVSVRVSKKKSGEFRDLIAGTGKLPAAKLDKIDGAIANKGQATVVLDDEAEAIDVEYWTADDGAAFLEALHPADPTQTSED